MHYDFMEYPAGKSEIDRIIAVPQPSRTLFS
ncbi:Uncharacterised protein [Bordetella pertussis]|nr:Uncharacterised protein [Bordetella pertussis]